MKKPKVIVVDRQGNKIFDVDEALTYEELLDSVWDSILLWKITRDTMQSWFSYSVDWTNL
jgi:hypothetical protein